MLLSGVTLAKGLVAGALRSCKSQKLIHKVVSGQADSWRPGTLLSGPRETEGLTRHQDFRITASLLWKYYLKSCLNQLR